MGHRLKDYELFFSERINSICFFPEGLHRDEIDQPALFPMALPLALCFGGQVGGQDI